MESRLKSIEASLKVRSSNLSEVNLQEEWTEIKCPKCGKGMFYLKTQLGNAGEQIIEMSCVTCGEASNFGVAIYQVDTQTFNPARGEEWQEVKCKGCGKKHFKVQKNVAWKRNVEIKINCVSCKTLLFQFVVGSWQI